MEIHSFQCHVAFKHMYQNLSVDITMYVPRGVRDTHVLNSSWFLLLQREKNKDANR